jgi:hypothetical protein
VIARLLLVATLALATSPGARIGDVEEAYADLLETSDCLGILRAGGVRSPCGDGDAVARRREQGETVRRALEDVDPKTLSAEDRRAADTIRHALEDAHEGGAAEASSDEAGGWGCDYDASVLARGEKGLETLQRRMYACYGRAAHGVAFEGESLDRLTILARLGSEQDRETRKRLLLALVPLWRTVNGDGGAASPYRQMLALSAGRWKSGSSPIAENMAALGVAPEAMERWLESALEAWRRASGGPEVEPWDYWFAAGAAGRALAARVPRAELEPVTERYYASLGASPRALGVHYDLDARPGKTPVAFTDFGRHPRRARGAWVPAEPWVFATYEAGGFDNLVELLHETGHAVHIAAIRTRPAFATWPDSDTFTEALADVPALEAYEPEWQGAFLGASVPLADALRAKYSGIVMDIAWALLEVRLHRDPAADPNVVWTDLTHRYLGIVPHPELPWWAMRGQLVDAPGYMMNYAAGAVIVADVRARARALRGPFTKADVGWYPWLSERLYRFGLERSSKRVLDDFLGRPLSPDALLADLARLTPAGTGSTPSGGR